MLFLNRGITYANLGLHVDAITDYNKAITIDSTMAEAWYNRGVSKARFAYSKRCCIDIKKAADLNLDKAKTTYKENCYLYFRELGEIKD